MVADFVEVRVEHGFEVHSVEVALGKAALIAAQEAVGKKIISIGTASRRSNHTRWAPQPQNGKRPEP